MVSSSISEQNEQTELRQLLENLYQGQKLIEFIGGQAIPLNPEDIWVVCRGVVSLSSLNAHGEDVLLGFTVPSMPFGLPLATRSADQAYRATALSDVGLMRFSITEVDRSPLLCRSLWQQLSRRLQQTESILAIVGYRRIKDRLQQLLLLLKDEMGQPTADGAGVRLPVKLTHQNLANTIGATRVTVTRLIKELREEEWLSIDSQRYITICNAVNSNR
ncbi:Crp/Fnr family transcriptional regulator [Roseofilum casamattae]|uniref:Crp/Fnr family transcriptional regulator n=1 Tax=Roseofilum casamattae BLCC-M143 TaxID=3022442 RepID=A0ABT7C204_9CYAN|nr:Crp/Fnr family transcriptional regulator [Roseofilum casamattae]MDJ1185486.1 Crp/Fnr family transcriptional regulator [Roseofilum casamattae BLCC-M143]